MNKPEMKVIRFSDADVIATSGAAAISLCSDYGEHLLYDKVYNWSMGVCTGIYYVYNKFNYTKDTDVDAPIIDLSYPEGYMIPSMRYYHDTLPSDLYYLDGEKGGYYHLNSQGIYEICSNQCHSHS